MPRPTHNGDTPDDSGVSCHPERGISTAVQGNTDAHPPNDPCSDEGSEGPPSLITRESPSCGSDDTSTFGGCGARTTGDDSGLVGERSAHPFRRKSEPNRSYSVNNQASSRSRRDTDALCDRGANGSMAGRGMSIGLKTDRYVDVSGIQDHTVGDLNIVEGTCVSRSTKGNCILHVPECAHMGDGRTIFSSLQFEHFGCKVVDVSPEANNGIQPHIISPDGHVFPLSIKQGLPILEIRPVLEAEWDILPHVYMTASGEWDPSKLDCDIPDEWYKTAKDKVADHYEGLPYDQCGNIKGVDDERSLGSKGEFNRAEMEANLTELVKDELVDLVIEIRVDDDIYHRELDGYDETCDWDDWGDGMNTNRFSYDVEERRRSKRKTEPVNYAENKKKGKKKPNNRSPKAISNQKKAERGESLTDDTHEEKTSTDGTQETDSMTEEPITDYNNPAKNTSQNEKREITGGPLVGSPKELNWDKHAQFFGGVSEDVIRKTFENTTQLGRIGAVKNLKLWKRHKSPNPALNVSRRNEPVATDTIYGPTNAIDNGSTAAQLFIGRKSSFASAEGLGRSDKDYPKALLNHIRKCGAMDVIVSDHAAAELSKRVEQILNLCGIKQWSSEAYIKNQNYSEREWRDIKRMVELILNYTDAPMFTWLLVLECVCFIRNHTARERLGWRTPVEWLLGYTPDITVMLIFHFWEPVYYAANEAEWPSDNREALGMFVGIADCVGHAITFKILTKDHKIINRSVVRSATGDGIRQNERANKKAPEFAPSIPNKLLKIKDKLYPVRIKAESDTATEIEQESQKDQGTNLGSAGLWKKVNEEREANTVEVETVDEDEIPEDIPDLGEKPTVDPETVMEEIRLRTLHEDAVQGGGQLPTIDVENLVGRTFITTPDADGEQYRARIDGVEATDKTTADKRETLLKFRCKVGEKRFEEIMTHNKMIQWLDHDKSSPARCELEAVCGHRKRKEWEVLILWGTGQRSWHPLNSIYQDDPVSIALCAREHGLLEIDGWKRCKHMAKKAKKLGRMVNQARLKSFRNKPVYKCGVQVPRSHEEAMLIDAKNGDNRWAESEALEMAQLMECDSFESLGIGAPTPTGYKKIPCHYVYDIKSTGKFKSRVVAGGNRTDTPVDSAHSGVVSLPGIRVVTFLAELNDLELWGTDVGNAHLESYTTEKVAFIAGPEFGECVGHTMIILKAQCGLKSSGKCWHDRLHDVTEGLWIRTLESRRRYLDA